MNSSYFKHILDSTIEAYSSNVSPKVYQQYLMAIERNPDSIPAPGVFIDRTTAALCLCWGLDDADVLILEIDSQGFARWSRKTRHVVVETNGTFIFDGQLPANLVQMIEQVDSNVCNRHREGFCRL